MELYPSGFWRSADAGQTWQPMTLPPDAQSLYSRSLQIVDAAADTLVIGADDQYVLYASVDGGTTWVDRTPHPAGFFYETGGIVDPRRRDRWYALGRFTRPPYGAAFARSDDGGDTWQTFVFPRIGAAAFAQWLYPDPLSDSTLWSISYYRYSPTDTLLPGGIMRSTDLGQTWTEFFDFHAHYASQDVAIGSFLHQMNGDFLFSFNSCDGDTCIADWLRSTDNGQTWTSQRAGWPGDDVPWGPVIEDIDQPGRLYTEGWDFQHPVACSPDNGDTWSSCSNGIPASTRWTSGLRQNPDNGSLTIVASDAPWESIDDGASWHALPVPPVGATGPVQIHDESLTFYHFPGALFRQSFSSRQWEPITVPVFPDTVTSIESVLYDRAGVMLAAVSRYGEHEGGSPALAVSQLVRSVDHGQSWQFGPALPTDLWSWFTIETDSVPVFVASGWSDSLYVSNDLGEHWLSRGYPVVRDYYNFDCAERSNEICLVGSNEWGADVVVYRSTDLAATWQEIGPPDTPAEGERLEPTVFPGGVLIRFFRHNDVQNWLWTEAGWSLRSGDAASDGFLTVLDDPLRILLFSSGGDAWISPDTMRTWVHHDLELPFAGTHPQLGTVIYSPQTEELWGSSSLGPVRMNLNELAAPERVRFTPLPQLSLSAFPNPFNSVATISLNLAQPGPVSLRLYDLTGRLSAVVADRVLPAGEQRLRFDARRLPTGTYFLRLTADSRTRETKLLLLR